MRGEQVVFNRLVVERAMLRADLAAAKKERDLLRAERDGALRALHALLIGMNDANSSLARRGTIALAVDLLDRHGLLPEKE